MNITYLYFIEIISMLCISTVEYCDKHELRFVLQPYDLT